MGLVNYGSDSDSDGDVDTTSTQQPSAPAPSTSSIKLPPPSRAQPAMTTTTTSAKSGLKLPAAKKKDKGPLRMILDLPLPGASTAVSEDGAASQQPAEGEEGPAKKKLKLAGGAGGSGLSGLAAMLPKPKNEAPQPVRTTVSARAVGSLVGHVETAHASEEAGPSTAFVPHRVGKGKAKATTVAPPAAAATAPPDPGLDFFGIGAVSSAPSTSVPSTGTSTGKKSSITISSAPTIAVPPPPSTVGSQPTADDPYPGFTQLPSGQWVAKDQATYEAWMAWQAQSAREQQQQQQAAVPKDFDESEIEKSGGIRDVTEEQRAREAWANKPDLVNQRDAEGAKKKAMAKLGKVGKIGGGRARQKGQLSALLAEAVENRAELEERIAQGRANRKNAGNKYGF